MLTGSLIMLAALLVVGPALASQPTPWGIGFQEAASPIKEQINAFHNVMLVIIFLIAALVLALLVFVCFRFREKANPEPAKFTHNTAVEVLWTVIPFLIVIGISFYSVPLIFRMDRVENPEMTLVVRGYQWHWGYEYPDQQIDEFLSFMVADDDITGDQVRLLSTDAPVVLPVDTDIQILVGAADVLHSWAMPAFGIKTDAVPGRLNETWVRIDREGTYFGQCSEICGVGHAYMPIEVRAVSREAFDQWVIDQVGDDVDPDNPPVLLTMTWDEAVGGDRQLAQVAAD